MPYNSGQRSALASVYALYVKQRIMNTYRETHSMRSPIAIFGAVAFSLGTLFLGYLAFYNEAGLLAAPFLILFLLITIGMIIGALRNTIYEFQFDGVVFEWGETKGKKRKRIDLIDVQEVVYVDGEFPGYLAHLKNGKIEKFPDWMKVPESPDSNELLKKIMEANTSVKCYDERRA